MPIGAWGPLDLDDLEEQEAELWHEYLRAFQKGDSGRSGWLLRQHAKVMRAIVREHEQTLREVCRDA